MSKGSALSKLTIKRTPGGEAPYEVDDNVYRRFDQRFNLTVGRPNWDTTVQKFTRQTVPTRVGHIKSGLPGYHLEDYSLFLAGGVTVWSLETSINHANRGYTSWKSLGAKVPPGIEPWRGTPEAATAMVKQAARFFGADLVGIAPLDRRWIYSHAFWADGTHKAITFEPVDEPLETGERLVIPEKMRWVIVMGTRMDPGIIQYTPSPIGCAETRITYSRMGLQVSGVAEFLRGIGYQAIPSINDTGLSIPMAIDAGFGEQGRNGKLITPQFGPSVRLSKVITDLPLVRDYPVRFGVAEFCDTCRKCADACPVDAIDPGERTWARENISNSPGQRTWHLDNELCRRYWSTGKGDNCTVCVRSCPFTKGPGLAHELVKASISNAPRLNSVWRRLDDALGYGGERDASVFWEGE